MVLVLHAFLENYPYKTRLIKREVKNMSDYGDIQMLESVILWNAVLQWDKF